MDTDTNQGLKMEVLVEGITTSQEENKENIGFYKIPLELFEKRMYTIREKKSTIEGKDTDAFSDLVQGLEVVKMPSETFDCIRSSNDSWKRILSNHLSKEEVESIMEPQENRLNKWVEILRELEEVTKDFEDGLYYHLTVTDESCLGVWGRYSDFLKYQCETIPKKEGEEVKKEYIVRGRVNRVQRNVSKDVRRTLSSLCHRPREAVPICYRYKPERRYYSKRIRSRRHLINTILYIQTRGDRHCNHKYTKWILDNVEERMSFIRHWGDNMLNIE